MDIGTSSSLDPGEKHTYRSAALVVVETLFLCQSRIAGENPLLIWGHKVNR